MFLYRQSVYAWPGIQRMSFRSDYEADNDRTVNAQREVLACNC